MSRSRPLVAIPGRFSASASALRFGAVVTARALSQAVLRAGGEPLTVHPVAPGGIVTAQEVASRLAFADAVLLPGGGDVAPWRYGEPTASDQVYDVDEEQDGFDLAVARWALDTGIPLLAVCRGLHVVDVAMGGRLQQDMAEPHRHVVSDVSVAAGSLLHDLVGPTLSVSCYHHQRVTELGAGLRGIAWAKDGGLEAIEADDRPGWFLGVQWHPEDSSDRDSAQQAIMAALVTAAR